MSISAYCQWCGAATNTAGRCTDMMCRGPDKSPVVVELGANPRDAVAAAALAWAEAYIRRIDVPFDLWKARVTIAEAAYRAARGSAAADVSGRGGEG